VHRLFYESLVRFGTLCLGNKESMRFSPYESRYEEVDAAARMYRRAK
jgi:chemotaxis protein methyltransferase CheR